MAGPGFILNSELLANNFCQMKLPKELAGMTSIIGLAQHRRTLTSPAHRWLTEKIAAITTEHWRTKSKRKKSKKISYAEALLEAVC